VGVDVQRSRSGPLDPWTAGLDALSTQAHEEAGGIGLVERFRRQAFRVRVASGERHLGEDEAALVAAVEDALTDGPGGVRLGTVEIAAGSQN
jgi:hypothetical protein